MPSPSRPQRPFKPARTAGTTRIRTATTIGAGWAVAVIARQPIDAARQSPFDQNVEILPRLSSSLTTELRRQTPTPALKWTTRCSTGRRRGRRYRNARGREASRATIFALEPRPFRAEAAGPSTLSEACEPSSEPPRQRSRGVTATGLQLGSASSASASSTTATSASSTAAASASSTAGLAPVLAVSPIRLRSATRSASPTSGAG
jgi:hypothetical protein